VPPLLAEMIGLVLATIMKHFVIERLKMQSRKAQKFPPRAVQKDRPSIAR
jgi:hypothetical protein